MLRRRSTYGHSIVIAQLLDLHKGQALPPYPLCFLKLEENKKCILS